MQDPTRVPTSGALRTVSSVLTANILGWQVKPLDVAFVGTFAAIASPASAYVVARIQRRTDRQARTYDAKRQAYLDVLKDACNGELHLQSWLRLAEPDASAATAKETIEALHYTLIEENNRVAAFRLVADENVVTAYREFIDVWNGIISDVDIDILPTETISASPDHIRRIKRGLEDLQAPLKRLRVALRNDLNG